MGLNIDEELNAIIRKYKLYSMYKERGIYYEAIDLIDSLFSNISEDTVLALQGAGKHTEEFLKILAEIGHIKKIHYIVQKENINTDSEMQGIKILDSKEADSYGITMYITSSYIHGAQMAVDIRRQNKQVEIVDLYQYFRINGLVLAKEFYRYKLDSLYVQYTDVYYLRDRYLRSSLKEDRKTMLQMIIFLCIELKAFLQAFSYIEEYKENGFDEDNSYGLAKEEIERLLKAIDEAITSKAYGDIIINWIDCVSYEEINGMPYIQEIAKEGILFNNAFSAYASTHATMENIFKATMVKEGEATSYFNDRITIENSPVLEQLSNAGYDFKYITYPNLYTNMFTEENTVYNKKVSPINLREECSTRLQWRLLQERINEIRPCCYLVHNLAETHYYYVSPEEIGYSTPNRELNKEEQRNRINSQYYLDAQLRYYGRFLRKNDMQVFLSDHGYTNQSWVDDRHKVIMIVKGESLRKGKEERLYTHTDFNKVIRYIIKKDSDLYDDIFCEKVYYHNTDVYGPEFVKRICGILDKNKVRGCINNKYVSSYFQYYAIRTKEYLFVKYYHGKELFYVLPDTSFNRILEKEYAAVIKEYREICNNCMISPEKDDFFSVCKKLYEYIPQFNEDTW